MIIKVADFKDLLNGGYFKPQYVENVAKHMSETIEMFLRLYEQYSMQRGIDLKGKTAINRNKLDMSIVDALDDIKRVIGFHPVKDPSVIKFTAYISYWLLQHKPIMLLGFSDNLKNEKEKIKLQGINEWFCVQYMFNMIFDETKFFCEKYHLNNNFKKDIKVAQEYLFYYFRYRHPTAKDIDAYMNALIVHPAYKLNKDVKMETVN